MNYFTLFALVILTLILAQDYKRDAGKNKKAKIFHAICLAILVANYAGSFRILSVLIRNFDKARERFSVDVGLVPGQLHFIFYLVHSVLAMAVILLVYQMTRRNDKSRKLMVTILPFLAILEIFSFYRGWIFNGDGFETSAILILSIGFILIGGLTSGIIAVYKSRFMTSFFKINEQRQNFNSSLPQVQQKPD
ncbi:MAG: hypothetical protein KF775_10420 [Cyclobacteriaceae bacterium]|nr:hypothetical protein [Cyclobacteriaceae bacterium]